MPMERDDVEPNLYGSAEFWIEELEDRKNWQRNLIDQLCTKIETATPVIKLPHDYGALYATLDGDRAMRLNFPATTDSCRFEATVVRTAELGDAVEHDLSGTIEDTPTIVRQFIRIYAVVIDTLSTAYGDNDEATRYLLEVKPPTDQAQEYTASIGSVATNASRELVAYAATITPQRVRWPSLPLALNNLAV